MALRDLKWRALREQLDAQGASSLAAVIEPVVLEGRPPIGRSGRGLIATVVIGESVTIVAPNENWAR